MNVAILVSCIIFYQKQKACYFVAEEEMTALTSSLASKVGSDLGFRYYELHGLPPPSVQISIQRHSCPLMGTNDTYEAQDHVPIK